MIFGRTSTRIRLFADDCIIYRKGTNKHNIEKLQKDLEALGEWAVENGMKVNPGESKAIRFARIQAKNSLVTKKFRKPAVVNNWE